MSVAPDYRLLLGVYGGLLVLLAATMAVARLGLGPLGAAISLGIAVAKAALIFWFFMQLRERNGLVRLFAAAAVFWILLLFALATADFVTRTTAVGDSAASRPLAAVNLFASRRAELDGSACSQRMPLRATGVPCVSNRVKGQR